MGIVGGIGMTRLKLAEHSTDETMIVEVWRGAKMIAHVYPSEHGIRIMGEHFDSLRVAVFDPGPPATLDVQISQSE